MSRCAPFREMLLVADPGELRGEGSGPLAAHLRTCARCRTAAQAVLGASEALDQALSGEVDPAAVDAVLRRARGSDAPAARPSVGPLPWRRRPGTWGLSVATLAAAALAGILLTRGHQPSAPASTPSRIEAAPLPVLADASARHVAVLGTDDPDITVLWFFQEE